MTALILPRRFTRQPQGSVEIDRSHPIARGLVAFYTQFGMAVNQPVDCLNNPLTFNKTYVDVNMQPYATPEGVVLRNTGTTSITYGVEAAFPVNSSALDAGDITYLADLQIDSFGTDIGLISFNNGPWSWLDTQANTLRISAYTAYDTTNVINTAGRYLVGLIWRKNNTYQTIHNGRFSQSGSATRGGVWGNVAKTSRGAATNGLWQSGTSGNLSTPYWYALWNRSLSEGETLAMRENPWQIFKPRKAILYFGGGAPTNYPSAADAGTLTLTGSAANGVRALAGVAASGSIALTGSAANAVRALAGVAASGSITLTGSNAAALRTWLGVAGAGSITLTGSDAAGVKAGSGAYTSAADAGSITLSGSAAVGTYDRLAAAGAGSITITGSDASGIRNIPATAEAGSIVLTGSAAVGIRTWLAAAEAGSITLSGSDAEGVYGGAMTLTPADLDAIAAAVWADPAAVAAHAKLDEIIARITC